MPATPKVHYENREIDGERLGLTNKEAMYWFGPNLSLRRCTVLLGSGGRQFVPMWGRLIDCTIEAKREFADAWLTSLSFEGCRFSGRYSRLRHADNSAPNVAMLYHPGTAQARPRTRERPLAGRFPSSHLLKGPRRERPDRAALSFYAPAEAKRSGTTLEELKAAVERFDFIVR